MTDDDVSCVVNAMFRNSSTAVLLPVVPGTGSSVVPYASMCRDYMNVLN